VIGRSETNGREINLKKYDTFLFDADNTLYDYDLAEKNALTIMLERHGISCTAEILEKYREINMNAWGRFERGEISKIELQSSRFERLFNYMGTSVDGTAFNAGYLVQLGTGSYLIDGAYELCKSITDAGKRIYIVTNGLQATQDARIKHSTINMYISESFISEAVGYDKPHIKYFEHVFANIPMLQKDKTLIIGDNLRADISGGNNAGIDTCWFNLYAQENNTGITPTYEILKLDELRIAVIGQQ